MYRTLWNISGDMPIFSHCKKVAISTKAISGGVSGPKFTKLVHDVEGY